jgi:hypothetical protein
LNGSAKGLCEEIKKEENDYFYGSSLSFSGNNIIL